MQGPAPPHRKYPQVRDQRRARLHRASVKGADTTQVGRTCRQREFLSKGLWYAHAVESVLHVRSGMEPRRAAVNGCVAECCR
eukprot:6287254-Heterocapsa_arctica.AAC.1